MNSLNNFLIRKILSFLPNNDSSSFISTCKKYNRIYSREEKEDRKVKILKDDYGFPGEIQVRNNDVFIVSKAMNTYQEIFLKNVDFRKYICDITVFHALSFNNLPTALKEFCDGMHQRLECSREGMTSITLITVDEDDEEVETIIV